MTKYYARFPTVLGGTQSQLIEGQQSNCCSPPPDSADVCTARLPFSGEFQAFQLSGIRQNKLYRNIPLFAPQASDKVDDFIRSSGDFEESSYEPAHTTVCFGKQF